MALIKWTKLPSMIHAYFEQGSSIKMVQREGGTSIETPLFSSFGNVRVRIFASGTFFQIDIIGDHTDITSPLKKTEWKKDKYKISFQRHVILQLDGK